MKRGTLSCSGGRGFAAAVSVVRFLRIWVYCSIFFFSSRRRHTSCSRDWSSDVCSSDLRLADRRVVRLHQLDGVPLADGLRGLRLALADGVELSRLERLVQIGVGEEHDAHVLAGLVAPGQARLGQLGIEQKLLRAAARGPHLLALQIGEPGHPALLAGEDARAALGETGDHEHGGDRKSTRLNSSHGYISYAVFCLKKKKK